ncbi:polysaccharide pyruvyl transferase family protein [Clostridium sp. 'White wine YQ']|uniref:polysaccharide pyruvyl transferase family protein n=1 Tax=Clostridium sp. 'White wine YQ' TaxID=3027474 RepID=UPI002365AD2E|nr:polysaccharide pyruvyl transferase family protein [Clostridium sp. 'White wine YQ']MDD7792757.1 polysaccharide pyruvyl transferase family protein [Clostridium sp. 'White wine YQ']
MKNIVISGWYGNENCGDEVILQEIVRNVKSIDKHSNIVVMSFNIKHTNDVHNLTAVNQIPIHNLSTIKSFIKGNLFETIKNIRKCDLFMMGGGGFLSDWQNEVPFGWLKQMILAKMYNRKTILYGIGAGPFNTKGGKRKVAFIINKFVDYVLVRDKISEEELISCGVNKAKVILGIDPVFNVMTEKQNSLKKEKVIGINLVELFNSEEYWSNSKKRHKILIDKFISLIFNINKKYPDYKLRFIPMMKSDASFIENILKSNPLLKMEIDKNCLNNIEYTKKCIAECEIFIGMRCHSLILSLSYAIPTIGIVYHHKSLEAMKNYGMEDKCIYITDEKQSNLGNFDLDVDKLLMNLEEIINKSNVIKEDIISNRNGIEERMKKNIDILKEALNN